MAILKNKISKSYTMIPNWIISESKINNNAFRLLVYLYSKPDNWNVNQNNISREFNVTRATINKWMSDLKDTGAIEIIRNGRDYEYHLLVSNNLVSKNLDVKKFGVKDSLQHNNTDIYKDYISNNNTEFEFFGNVKVNNAFLDFLEMRKEMKKKPTAKSIEMLVNKLNKYEDDIKLQAINKSIECSYQGIFPEGIKESSKNDKHMNLMNILQEV